MIYFSYIIRSNHLKKISTKIKLLSSPLGNLRKKDNNYPSKWSKINKSSSRIMHFKFNINSNNRIQYKKQRTIVVSILTRCKSIWFSLNRIQIQINSSICLTNNHNSRINSNIICPKISQTCNSSHNRQCMISMVMCSNNNSIQTNNTHLIILANNLNT